MTAFISRYLRNARFDLIGLMACVCLVWAYAGPVRAQSPAAEISQLRFERAGDAILLSAVVNFELPEVVEEALLKGVAIIFVAEADVVRERWYWTNKRVARAERHMRLAYQPLTRRWRLNIASGVITTDRLGVALNQYFDTLADALAAIQRISRWKVADASELDLEQRHLVEFRLSLDVSQLPRPLQIGTLGQSDWNISASTSRDLVLDSGK